MPAPLTYPGVYIEEISSGVRTITGVATSIAAFLGRAARGPVNAATTILNFADYERIFGGLDPNSAMSFAVRDFFMNGGSQAVVVRLFRPVLGDKAKARAAALAVLNAINDESPLDKALEEAQTKDKEYRDPVQHSLEEKLAADGMLLALQAFTPAAAAKPPMKNGKDLKGAVADKVDGLAETAVKNELIPSKATLDLPFKASGPIISLEAASEGAWGADLRGTLVNSPKTEQIARRYGVSDKSQLFDLQIRVAAPGGAVETISNLTFQRDSARFIVDVLKQESQLVRWRESASDFDAFQAPLQGLSADLAIAKTAFDDAKTHRDQALDSSASTEKQVNDALDNVQKQREAFIRTLPQDDLSVKVILAQGAQEDLQIVLGATKLPTDVHDKVVAIAKGKENAAGKALADATKDRDRQSTDGDPLDRNSYFPAGGANLKLGLYAFDTVDLFNLLCLPTRDDRLYPLLLSEALAYCEMRRAMLIVDPPAKWQTSAGKMAGALKDNPLDALANDVNLPGPAARNAALFYPRVKYPNPLRAGTVEEFVPCGVVAGTFARTDAQRGVWKAPAGLDASLSGVQALSVNLTDAENGLLNPLGINCLRSFPAAGRVVWGSRTLRGADQLADEYKYVPVRRTALFIEESLYRGTQWAIFEPNDEPLWAQLRLNIGSFLHDLFRQGAFQGRSPREAYFVKCDKETTTQSDINRGIVHVVIGFAPLKPAEFVVIRLQQMAGQPDQQTG